MYYVVIDPCANYPVYMINFLSRFGLKAIAVFSEARTFHTWRHLFAPVLADHVVDEYLVTEWQDLGHMAARIRADHPGEIHGIIPWDELTIQLGAAVGDALGLDWNPPEVIQRFRNKFAMKDAVRRHGGIPINASAIVHDMDEVYQFQREVGSWPIVVKPTEGAGSSGVFFANNLEELEQAAVRVFHHGWGEVLLEEYVGGTEHVVNGITDARGAMLITDVWRYDKRDIGDAKNIYFQTVKVNTWEDVWEPLTQYAAAVVHALGLRKAPVHMELKIDEHGPCLIEVGARFAGGNQPLLSSELHGRSLFELAACHYLDDLPLSPEDVHYDRYDGRQARIISGVQVQPLPYISRILGVDEVRQLPSFYSFGKLLPLGSPVPQTVDLMSKSWEVYLLHDDPRQIEYDAEQCRALLKYL